MSVFPEIIRHIPQRDYGIEGLTIRVDHTSTVRKKKSISQSMPMRNSGQLLSAVNAC